MDFDLNTDPGEGNLNLRAYLAAIVGPKRVAFGQRQTRQLRVDGAVEVAKNPSRNKEAFYVAAWIPIIEGVGPGVGFVVRFGSSDTASDTDDLVTLVAVGGASFFPHYESVLLIDEQLYASVVSRTDGAPLADRTPLVVSQVAF